MAAITNVEQPRPAGGTEPSRSGRGQHANASQTRSSPLPADATHRSATTRRPADTVPVSRQNEFHELAAHLQRALAAAIPEPCSVCFRWAEEDNLFILEVRSESTGELIKQYPPEKILNIRRRLDELLGVMIDRQV